MSIFRRALGEEFDRLHPAVRERFAIADGTACIGTGTMDRIWRGPVYTVPFLRLGASRNILFAETGVDVPFTIENHAYTDGHGRPTITFVRTFDLGRGLRRRFDATMVFSERRGCIVDYLGTHQHIAVDLHLSVRPDGGLRIRTGAQRLHEGRVSLGLPAALTGTAEVDEWFDESTGGMRIEVRVRHARLGPIFGYRGGFSNRVLARAGVPAAVKPRREQPRD